MITDRIYLESVLKVAILAVCLSFRLVRNLSDGFTEGFPTRFTCGNDSLWVFPYIYKQNLFSIMITMYVRHIELGKFSEDGLDRIIRKGSEIMDVAKHIDFLSTQFLDTDYAESTLIGDKDTPEVFVINLLGVDCLTFIEYIEAMRLSDSFYAFESNLRKVRYKYGIVEFANRNHFFTDWIGHNAEFVHNATEEIGG